VLTNSSDGWRDSTLGDRQLIAGAGTYDFNTRIPLRALERVALQLSDAPAIVQRSGVAGADSFYWDPALGSVPFDPASDPGVENMWNADVEPDADRDGYGDETQDACLRFRSVHTACDADLYIGQGGIRMKKGVAHLTFFNGNRSKFTAVNPVAHTAAGPGVEVLPPVTPWGAVAPGCTGIACPLTGQRTMTLDYPLAVAKDGPVTVTVSLTGSGGDSNPEDNTVTFKGRFVIDAPRLPRRRVRMSGPSAVPLGLKCVRLPGSMPNCSGILTVRGRNGRRNPTVAKRRFALASGHSGRVTIRLPRWARQEITQQGSMRLVLKTVSPGGTAWNSSTITVIPSRG
jgi:hypothetical protein